MRVLIAGVGYHNLRDEILQVRFWMRGEDLSDAPTADQLAPFLTTDAVSLLLHLERMAADGFLMRKRSADKICYAPPERSRSRWPNCDSIFCGVSKRTRAAANSIWERGMPSTPRSGARFARVEGAGEFANAHDAISDFATAVISTKALLLLRAFCFYTY